MLTPAKARKLISLASVRNEAGKRVYAVTLTIGYQSFKIDTGGARTKREASWFADQLATALAKLDKPSLVDAMNRGQPSGDVLCPVCKDTPTDCTRHDCPNRD